MKGKENRPKKSTIFDFFIRIVDNINLSGLPSYEKLNLLLTVILVIVVLALAIPPALVMIDNIIISVGNVIIIALGKSERIQPIEASSPFSIEILLLIVAVESIACLILCQFYKNTNHKS